MKLVYTDKAKLPIGEHIFQGGKYCAVHKRLLETGAFTEEDFLAPEPCRDADLLLVHTRLWVEKIRNGTLSTREELELEVPYSKELAQAFCYMTGGSILAAGLALQHGCAVHLGGGFHHAFADHGEGFCLVNDVAVAIRRMQRDGRIERAMVVDCDVHQGNGTAAIFGTATQEPFPFASVASSHAESSRAEPSHAEPSRPETRRRAHIKTGETRDVFTISLHQESNYPTWKPPSSLDVNLPDGTGDAEYLEWLQEALQQARERFEPELVCYVAGADPYAEDQLGGLAMSMEGMKERDRTVFRFARDNGYPVMTTLAGGYARHESDTVAIHVNTALAAREVFG